MYCIKDEIFDGAFSGRLCLLQMNVHPYWIGPAIFELIRGKDG